MVINRDLLQQTPFKKFKRLIGREDAFEFLFKMWAQVESCKAAPIPLDEKEDLALLLDAPDELSGEVLYEAFVSTGLLDVDCADPIRLTSSLWKENNAKLVASWENGKRHKGKKAKETKPEETEAKGRKREEREQNQIETNQIEDNVSEHNLSRYKGRVNPERTQEEPRDEEDPF